MGLVKNVQDHGLEGLEFNFITAKVEELVNWSRSRSSWGGHVRSRLLRDRDDGGRRRALRPVPLRHGGLPRLAAPGRHHDRRRPRQPEDGARAPSGLRPDDGAQVGHLDGRLRQHRRHVQQLRDRAGRRPGRARRRLRPGLPADAGDADPCDRDAAPEDRGRRAACAAGRPPAPAPTCGSRRSRPVADARRPRRDRRRRSSHRRRRPSCSASRSTTRPARPSSSCPPTQYAAFAKRSSTRRTRCAATSRRSTTSTCPAARCLPTWRVGIVPSASSSW